MPRGAVRPRLIQLNHRAVVDPAMDITALVDEALRALGLAEQRIYLGNRGAALHEIGRASHRLTDARSIAAALAGMAELHPDPDPLAAVAAA